MLRLSAWLHLSLSTYLWLIAWIPLGNWNRQKGGTLLAAVFRGERIELADWGFLLFVALPAILFWFAYRRKSFSAAIAALVFDVVWLGLQIQAWWIPYILGTDKQWQLDYARGPSTKILPTFGHHVAPDGMHLMIHVLLVAALITGLAALGEIRLLRKQPR